MLLLACVQAISQNHLPKIMVIPHVAQNEDIRNVLENDVNKRIALTKIKESFDSKGYTTVDFSAKLKAMEDNAMFASENQTDMKALIIQSSGADVYIEAEIYALPSSTGNSVKIIITGYEFSTGNSLANKVGESGKFYTEDYAKLASKAIESCAEEFLNIMQSKFLDIIENGRSILVNFGFDEMSDYNMFSEVGENGLQLSDEIELWIDEHSMNHNYHIQGTTEKQMIFDEVRIPIKDQNGNNFNTNKFALEIFKFMRDLQLQISRDIKGNTIYITIK